MARFQLLLPVLLAALAGVALADSKFAIEGRVYCDTCRAGFATSASEYMAGAKVRLECRHYETGAVAQITDGVTDRTGSYQIDVEDNHDEEICEVVLVKSSQPGCSEIPEGRDRARVLISSDSGLASHVRHANSLGFLREKPLKECGLVLQQYALGVDG